VGRALFIRVAAVVLLVWIEALILASPTDKQNETHSLSFPFSFWTRKTLSFLFFSSKKCLFCRRRCCSSPFLSGSSLSCSRLLVGRGVDLGGDDGLLAAGGQHSALSGQRNVWANSQRGFLSSCHLTMMSFSSSMADWISLPRSPSGFLRSSLVLPPSSIRDKKPSSSQPINCTRKKVSEIKDTKIATKMGTNRLTALCWIGPMWWKK